MSDILIKGMKMPKRMPIKAFIFPDGRVTVTLHSGKILERKAAPVPPHGRLIDADALMHEAEWYCVEDMLENAPTIIPAEEGE